MANQWTNEQQAAIDLHHRNLLVSAAAGSGKTAVLVERIIQMITSPEGVDVDSLLVLTFTRAAATEMKERIASRLNDMLSEEGVNHNQLQRQLALLNHASITTIDSFCLRVVRDYFGELDLDPDFRVADEGERTLLEADCMEALLESSYEAGDPAFLNLAEAYGGKKNDENLEGYISKLYKFAQSDPYPEEWLKQAYQAFEVQSLEELEALPFVRYLMEDYKKTLESLLPLAEELHEICLEADGPDLYEPMCRSDLEQLKRVLAAKTLEEMITVASNVSFLEKSRKKMPNADINKREYVRAQRDNVKNPFKKVLDNLKKIDVTSMLTNMQQLKEPMEMLVKLTIRFGELVAEAKAEKNILDFSDLEHMALHILLGSDKEPTVAAMELQQQYVEILVDEYQDSNYLQDTILDAISRRREGHPNMFMVGDVKQSIYRFRMARPEIFMGRYDSYSEEESLYQKINLAKNFRSRKEVLEGINLIFRRIMTRSLGDVVYDRAAELYPGALYQPLTEETMLPAGDLVPPIGAHYVTDENHKALRLTLVDMDEDQNESFLMTHTDGMAVDKLTAQAHAVAEEILRVTDPETGILVQDKKTGLYRKASFRDITILMRSISNRADTFLEVLSARGIPVCAEAKGYFSALEVRTILSYLQIIDNPFQDIPLAAVMKSCMWNFSAEDFALIQGFYLQAGEHKDPRFYSALKYFLRQQENQENPLCQKLQAFVAQLEHYRQCAIYMQVQELIQHLYHDTGFYDYVSAMPAGLVRKRNLDMLVEKAISFENTSYHGLYQFVRYIEHLEKFDVDFEQGQMFGEQDDIVRIMSIHKSKGLEFPIVILACVEKKMNLQDARANVVLHADYGIAANYVDIERRCKQETLAARALKQKIKTDTQGEELRLLYVAMTRARELLVMVGSVDSADKLLDKYVKEDPTTGPLDYQTLTGVETYLDWILMAAGDQLEDWMDVNIRLLEDVFLESTAQELEKDCLVHEIKELAQSQNVPKDNPLWEKLEAIHDFRYAYAEACEIQSKFSVSELKHRAMKDKGLDFEDKKDLHPDLMGIQQSLSASLQEAVEARLSEQESLSDSEKIVSETEKSSSFTGADRGTAFHGMLELLDPARCNTPEEVAAGMEQIVQEGKMKAELAALVNPKILARYYNSELGQRFTKAGLAGKLYKEREFIMNIPAHEAVKEWKSDEPILIQGIIDAYWEEGEDLVLLDYKTDVHVTEQNLKDRYLRQFDLYEQALSQILGKHVKERYIWSFYLGKAVKL